jgi:hypothetical protein
MIADHPQRRKMLDRLAFCRRLSEDNGGCLSLTHISEPEGTDRADADDSVSATIGS